MNPVAELFKWLLERDIRTKNAVSALVALVSVAVFYPQAHSSSWLRELERYGGMGVAIALILVFFIAYLTVWLLYSGVAAYCHNCADRRNAENERIAEIQQAQEDDKQCRLAIRNKLESLTDWQRKFLLRFVVEGRTQIPTFEVGQYRAAWDFEMAVLIEKGIVQEHRRAGVYEIIPRYLKYLQENWDPKAGTLG